MSLILEALKKSEAQRRLGEAPGLGTPITATRRRRSPLPWLILLAIAILSAGACWLFLRSPAQPVMPSTAAGANPTAKPSQGRPRSNPANITAMAPPDSDPRERTVHRPTDTAPGSTRPPDAPITTAAPPPNPIRPQVPASQSAPVAGPPVTTPARPVAPAAAVAPEVAPAIPAAILPPHGESPVVEPAPPATATAAPTAQPISPAPVYANVQNIEDLPYNLRKDVPDLPISMQVYSPDPARRFIIMGGNRKVEGDNIKDGVVLREVRPNGIVLEFRGQRFFVSRPGS